MEFPFSSFFHNSFSCIFLVLTTIKEAMKPEVVLKILQPDGPLSLSLKGFESREQQQQMTRNVIDAYNDNAIALIEAGTGTGKSLAYLIPAVLWAHNHKERTVISTNTITLQEQLINKDIPLLLKVLNLELKAVLVKGMSNYVCLRKLDDTKFELPMLPPQESEELRKIEAWADSSADGTRSDLPFVPHHSTWEKVCAEYDTCTHIECPFYQNCHFFKARREAQEAQILVVNHHLLFADLASRAENDSYDQDGVLPSYKRVIIDEAHNIEDIATEYFASRISQFQILRVLGRLAAEKTVREHGKLPTLKQKLSDHFRKISPITLTNIMTRLNMDLPATRNDIQSKVIDAFQAFEEFVNLLQNKGEFPSEDLAPGERKQRLLPHHQTHPAWASEILTASKNLIEVMRRYIQMIQSLEADLKELNNDSLNDSTKGIRFDILALANRLDGFCVVLENFIAAQPPPNQVRWIDVQPSRSMKNIQLIDADLDISKRLVDYLFSKFSTIVLCSATLTTNQQFDFFRQRLGITPAYLNDRKITQNIYDSPFNFHQQAMLAIPTDIPPPQHPDFSKEAAGKIWDAIQASHGNAFVLFTSYKMMKNCHDQLRQRLEQSRYHVLKQGDDNRQSLLTRFKNTDNIHSVRHRFFLGRGGCCRRSFALCHHRQAAI